MSEAPLTHPPRSRGTIATHTLFESLNAIKWLEQESKNKIHRQVIKWLKQESKRKIHCQVHLFRLLSTGAGVSGFTGVGVSGLFLSTRLRI